MRAMRAQEGFGTFALPVDAAGRGPRPGRRRRRRRRRAPGPPGRPHRHPRRHRHRLTPATATCDDGLRWTRCPSTPSARGATRCGCWRAIALRPDGAAGRRPHVLVRSSRSWPSTAGLLITFVLAVAVRLAAVRAVPWVRPGRAIPDRRADGRVRIPDPVPPLTATSWFGRLRERVRSGAALEGDRLPPRPPPGRRARLRPDDRGVGRLAGDAAAAGYVDDLAGRLGEVLLLRDHARAPARGWPPRVGVVGLVVVAPWITIGVGRLELALARALLGPSADAEHAAQVTRLETSRTAAVDSAEAERRRIERDLHDGAQQRLVALAADLGAAREKLDTRSGGRARDGGRRPRGGQGGAEGDPRPRPRHPPGDPRGPRPRRRAVGRRRPLAGPGDPRRRRRQRGRRRRSRARRTSWSTRR